MLYANDLSRRVRSRPDWFSKVPGPEKATRWIGFGTDAKAPSLNQQQSAIETGLKHAIFLWTGGRNKGVRGTIRLKGQAR